MDLLRNLGESGFTFSGRLWFAPSESELDFELVLTTIDSEC